MNKKNKKKLEKLKRSVSHDYRKIVKKKNSRNSLFNHQEYQTINVLKEIFK